MNTLEIICVIYILLINIITYITYGIDKSKARKNKWRISEATLLFLAFIGGAIGALMGMKIFHHKTKKPRFAIGVPIMFLIQIIIILYFFGIYS